MMALCKTWLWPWVLLSIKNSQLYWTKSENKFTPHYLRTVSLQIVQITTITMSSIPNGCQEVTAFSHSWGNKPKYSLKYLFRCVLLSALRWRDKGYPIKVYGMGKVRAKRIYLIQFMCSFQITCRYETTHERILTNVYVPLNELNSIVNSRNLFCI